MYWGKRVDAEQVGERVVRVACDRCGCEYFYLLTRMGVGAATAPYGVGVGAATRSAQGYSRRELEGRLSAEAELVPCPRCHWVNEELVRGYRRGRYQGLGRLGLGVAFFGTVISLFSGCCIAQGPAADRRALPYCLFVGPALFVSFDLAMMLLQYGLSRRIRPNRHFPRAPEVPPGSPPALLRDAASGALLPAGVDYREVRDRGGWHYFRMGEWFLPPRCCECLRATAAGDVYPYQVTQTFRLEIPRCAECVRHAQRAFQRTWSIGALAGSLLGCAAAAAFASAGSFEFWVIVVSSSFLSVCIATYAAGRRTEPAKLKIVDRARCVARVRFRNAEYGRLVAEQNGGSGTAV